MGGVWVFSGIAHCKIETKYLILEIWLAPERKFSILNFAL